MLIIYIDGLLAKYCSMINMVEHFFNTSPQKQYLHNFDCIYFSVYETLYIKKESPTKKQDSFIE